MCFNTTFYVSDAEGANIKWWDMLIRNPIRHLSSKCFQAGTNHTNKNIMMQHPNRAEAEFLLSLDNVLVVKGKEKGSTSELDLAKMEVVAKMAKMHLSLFE
ncbi:unnamed protein product [Albugo candida]|uniref:Uncharacterized protein n=1 Tax=Albugo candida TaxID=65357 RepID=A0A024G2I6_9STRA|nr:unnamed protein product [Albugo candida]|eukprot:CCI41068.1 unnamed protein product [Albugo candida]